MEQKNYIDQSHKIIDKIKFIKNLSPSNKDMLLKRKSKEEQNEQNNNYNNIKQLSLSPFNNPNKPLSNEKDLFNNRSKNKSREKEKEKDRNNSKNNSINKKKNLTPLMHKYKKKNLHENQNNYGLVKNVDESTDKKAKLYENQREPSFLKKYMAKVRENETGEGKAGEKSINENNSFRENIANDNIKDINENGKNNEKDINNIVIQSYDNKNKNKGNKNLENKNKHYNNKENKDLQNKENYKEFAYNTTDDNINISFNVNEENDTKTEEKNNKSSEKVSIKIDNSNKTNIFSDLPKISTKEKINLKTTQKNINKAKRSKNKSVELRKKKLLIPNINLVSISNSSRNNLSSNLNTEENNNYKSFQQKNVDNKFNTENNKVVNIPEISYSKKAKVPKLNLNSKSIKQENNLTERSLTNTNINDNLICLLCNKNCKKPLMCPKCHKICCESCIKIKKKKNKFCSFCNYYLKDFSKYIQIKNINNYKRNLKNNKNKETKDINNETLNKISEHNIGQSEANNSNNKKKSFLENTPSFKQKNISDKKIKNKKLKYMEGDKSTSSKNEEKEERDENIKINKSVNESNKKKYDSYLNRNKKYNTISDKPKKEKIKQKESIDVSEFDTIVYKDNKKEENENILKNSYLKERIINYKEEIEEIKEDNDSNDKSKENENINNNLNEIDNNENNNDNKEKNKKNEEKNVDIVENVDIIENKKEIEVKKKCSEHIYELKYYCCECDKEFCEECLNNHKEKEHNIIDYLINNNIKLRELISKKNSNNEKNNVLEKNLNNLEQKIKSYKLEEQIFISEINKIANDYIINIESKINDIKIIMEKIKNEQNTIIENNKILNEQFNLFYKLNKENNNIDENEFALNNKLIENENIDFSTDIQKFIENKNNFKFNYFTSQEIYDITINIKDNTILFSKIFFDDNNLNCFINDLMNYNNKISNDNNYNTDLKKYLYENIDLNSDSFTIKNLENTALIQINIKLNKKDENSNENIFYDNIKCYLLISNKEINNYCELDKKMISNGNLCFYNLIPWEQFSILSNNNLSFKVIVFNYYK